ncbi:hypothetical protein V8F20_012512 [Naviculisporaceae sp. PSN 640]
MKLNQPVGFSLLAAIVSLPSPATCIHVQNATQSSSTTWSNPGTATPTTLISSSEPPYNSSTSSTTLTPTTTTTAKPIPFGMIVRESGAITLTWRRCGEGLSSSSTTSTASSASAETVTDLEVFPTILPDPTETSPI